jgi:hypothetical protein
MKSISDHIRDHLLSDVITTPVGDKTETYEQILAHPLLKEAQEKGDQRLGMGHFRYGDLAAQRHSKKQYDNVASIKRRLDLYQETHNMEHIIDAMNICRVIYVTDTHPDRHFESQDDGEHTQEVT